YRSLAAFSRAFARAYGMPPGAFARSEAPLPLDAPNGVHFHPPAGLLLPASPAGPGDLSERLVRHHPHRVRELLAPAATMPRPELERPLRPGFVAVRFVGEEPSAALMAERLASALSVLVAALPGR